MKKNILVFGGAGFLGTYLVDELLRRNYSVTVADVNPYCGEAKYIKCDISCHDSIKKAFELEQFNFVYNLAGFANLDMAIKFPLKTMELNLMSNMRIVEECLNNNVDKYIYASSAYAMSNKGSFYGISKLASEKTIEEYNKTKNLKFVILRYGSVYSEKNFNNNYIFNLIKNAIESGKIVHGGDGNEIREYIHASDASKLSVDVIETEQYDNMHVILTGTERIRRNELFDMINEILNNKLEITYKKDGYNNHYRFTPYSFQPSVSKKLVANPHIDMGQGLLACIREVNELTKAY